MKSGIVVAWVGIATIGCGWMDSSTPMDAPGKSVPCDADLVVRPGAQAPSVALQAALDSASPGSVIAVDPGTYAAVVNRKDVHVVGRDGTGTCAPALGEGGPVLEGLDSSQGTFEGIGVRGVVSLSGSATVRSGDLRNGQVTLQDQSSLAGFLAVHAPVVARGASRVVGGLLVLSPTSGVRLEDSARLDHVTCSGNAGHGLVLAGEQAIAANVLTTDNGGAGLMEEVAPRVLEHVGFHGNARGGYVSVTGEGAGPRVRVERDLTTVTVMMPGNRRGTEPALATGGIVRASLYSHSPHASTEARPKRESPASEWVRALRPRPGVHGARRVLGGNRDASGRIRGPNPPIGGLSPGSVVRGESRVFVVAPEGMEGAKGDEDSPLSRIQEAVDRARDGDEIRVLPGRYSESVFVRGKAVRIRGMRRTEAGMESILDPGAADLPVVDPSATGAPHFGLFLEDVRRPTRIEGIGVEGAGTGIVVIGRRDDAPPAPTLSHVRVRGNEKGLDSDCGEGVLRDSLFQDNRIGATFRSANLWRLEGNHFLGKGADLVFSMTMMHGLEGFRVVRNRLEGEGGVRVDSILGRQGAALIFEENLFGPHSTLHVRRGSPESRVEVHRNAFTAPGGIALEGVREGAPQWRAEGNTQDGRNIQASFPEVNLQRPLGEEGVHPHAGPIAWDPVHGRVAAVAVDHGGIALMDFQARAPRHVATGKDPRGVAFTPDGREVLVTGFGDGTLSFVEAETGEVQATIPVGVEPFGVVIHPDGRRAWVSLSGEDAVVEISVKRRRVVRRHEGLAANPRGLAFTPAAPGERLFISHFSPARGTDPEDDQVAPLRPVLTILDLHGRDVPRRLPLPALENRRFPAAIGTLMPFVVARGNRVFVPSLGATPSRPRDATRKKRPILGFEATVQSLWYAVDANREVVLTAESDNLNRPGSILNGPHGVAFSEGSLAYVVSYGNDSVARLKLHEGSPPSFVRPWRGATDLLVGANPRGVVHDPRRNWLWTVDFADGTLSAVDVAREERVAVYPLGPPSRDRLSPLARRGKRLFYATNRVASAADFWFTCGTCHPDGRTDGVTWRFPAGMRSTPMLAGSLDTLPLHFDADRDQFADFEHTVRGDQGGFGLVRGGIPAQLGGPIDGGREWDAIEAYIREGVDAPRVHPGARQAMRGRALYRERGCHHCHGGGQFGPPPVESSQVDAAGRLASTLRDVGTRASRDVPSKGGFDPPSLWGVARTGPYLHDGSVATLEEVLEHPRHVNAGVQEGVAAAPLTKRQRQDLVAFLRTLSTGTPAVD